VPILNPVVAVTAAVSVAVVVAVATKAEILIDRTGALFDLSSLDIAWVKPVRHAISISFREYYGTFFSSVV
jgi:hypothetical protein